MQALKAKTLAVSLQHALALMRLPLHHRDPFDRFLIAQAKEEGLTLLTRDGGFKAYGVQTVW
ncbi:MAG: type II toxin-antitoxin system VapC family toxin [Acidobacteriota bacterium]|nr:type II toxin-antitoxin system VapC family toxin [Acidobacteriota bacterium]